MPYANKEKQREFQAKWMAARREEYFKDKTCSECKSNYRLNIVNNGNVPKGVFSHKNREKILQDCKILCEGCYLDVLADRAAITNFEHGHAAREDKTPTYKTWLNMRQRCTNPNSDNYEWYGGAGVTICSRWDEFKNFLADMGTRPAGHTIDRINPHGNYEPDNCRWATAKEQGRNKRRNKSK